MNSNYDSVSTLTWTLDGVVIKPSRTVKYLGLTVNSFINSWSPSTERLETLISFAMYRCRKHVRVVGFQNSLLCVQVYDVFVKNNYPMLFCESNSMN